MTYNVEISARAERDLIEIYDYIRAESSPAAAKWLDRLGAAIETLERLPGRCPRAPESHKSGRVLFHLLYGKPHVYRIIYEIHERSQTVFVLTISLRR